jgi:hypothetical protein
LVVVGTDDDNRLHIRIFDDAGKRVTDAVETEHPSQAGAIATLKEQLTDLLPPHVLTDAEKKRVIRDGTSIIGQTHSGHRAGSWDPDDSLYGTKGGRIYATALAALTLEVYYRYLRLYDEPKLPTDAGEPPGLAPPRREPAAPAFNPEDQ